MHKRRVIVEIEPGIEPVSGLAHAGNVIITTNPMPDGSNEIQVRAFDDGLYVHRWNQAGFDFLYVGTHADITTPKSVDKTVS